MGDPGRLSPAQQEAVASADPGSPLPVSDISLWEVAMLHNLAQPFVDSTAGVAGEGSGASTGVAARVSPAIAAEVAALPDSFHRDPVDRILVATARVLGATLLTQDQRIIEAELTKTLG